MEINFAFYLLKTILGLPILWLFVKHFSQKEDYFKKNNIKYNQMDIYSAKLLNGGSNEERQINRKLIVAIICAIAWFFLIQLF
jgi:hypothetical protein